MIGFTLAIGLMILPQDNGAPEINDLSPQAIAAIGVWKDCIDSNVSRVAQLPDSAEVAADGLLEYCRDQQRAFRTALSADLNRNENRNGQEITDSTETTLVMIARQNILSQIAAARQR